MIDEDKKVVSDSSWAAPVMDVPEAAAEKVTADKVVVEDEPVVAAAEEIPTEQDRLNAASAEHSEAAAKEYAALQARLDGTARAPTDAEKA